MATVEFLPNALGAGGVVEARGGARMIDVCDEARAPVAFSCRAASCGTCRVDVLCGAELLEPAGQEELDVLEIFAAPATQRLACQAVVREGEGVIRLAWVDD